MTQRSAHGHTHTDTCLGTECPCYVEGQHGLLDEAIAQAERANRHLDALAHAVRHAAIYGSHAAVEYVAEYLNSEDAVDADGVSAYMMWRARTDTPYPSVGPVDL